MFLIFRDQVPPKKNSRQLIKKKNKLISLPSEKYSEWHKFITNEIDNILITVEGLNEENKYQYQNIDNLEMNAVFYPNNNKKFDLTNVLQSIEDTLTDLKIIKDDDYNILSHFHYYIDKELLNKDIFLIVEIKPIKNTEILRKEFTHIHQIFNEESGKDGNRFIYKSKNKRIKKKKEKVFFNP